MSIVIAIILFSIIVLFHELGHFLLAKANGIRVNEFSLGLGPTLFGFTKGETKYINTTKSTDFICELEKKLHLPLTNYFLSETQIKTILKCKI